jgi:hypothetical protein
MVLYEYMKLHGNDVHNLSGNTRAKYKEFYCVKYIHSQ